LQKAQSAGDPSAFALAGEWEDRQLLATPAGADRLPHLLSGLRAYQQAARLGESAGWPEQTVRDWRFRRASLVRLLAKQQRMHEAGQTTAAAPR
jgi:hypothetical protein